MRFPTLISIGPISYSVIAGKQKRCHCKPCHWSILSLYLIIFSKKRSFWGSIVGHVEGKVKISVESGPQVSDWTHFNESDLALHVYESIELDIAFFNRNSDRAASEDKKRPFDYPIHLEVRTVTVTCVIN